jgi:hypothetical protein
MYRSQPQWLNSDDEPGPTTHIWKQVTAAVFKCERCGFASMEDEFGRNIKTGRLMRSGELRRPPMSCDEEIVSFVMEG